MRSISRALALGTFSVLLALHGCGLDVVGDAGGIDAATLPPASALDASPSAPVDGATSGDDAGDAGGPPPPLPASCTCALKAPEGWTNIAFASDRANPCAGDLATVDVVANPAASAGACTCAPCVVTAKPTCNTGRYGSAADNGTVATCGTVASVTHDALDGACNPDNGNLGNHGRAIAPPPIPNTATCTSQPVTDPAKVTATPMRACTTAASGTTCVCDAAATPGFRQCLRKLGVATCPPVAPNQVAVGAAVSPSCGPCSCSAVPTCSGEITFYSDANCATVRSVINDKQCLEEVSGPYNSIRWKGTTNVACTLGTSAAAAELTSPETICCP